jgi:hypothetical protein
MAKDKKKIPVSKQKISLYVSLASAPPNSHAVVSTRVTVCARKPCEGQAPYTGARLQYITVLGANSAFFSYESRGDAFILVASPT